MTGTDTSSVPVSPPLHDPDRNPGQGTSESGKQAGRGSRTAQRWPSPIPCSGAVVRLHTVPATRGLVSPAFRPCGSKILRSHRQRGLGSSGANDQDRAERPGTPNTIQDVAGPGCASGNRQASGLARRPFERNKHSREVPRQQGAASGVGRTGIVDSRCGGGRSGILDVARSGCRHPLVDPRCQPGPGLRRGNS